MPVGTCDDAGVYRLTIQYFEPADADSFDAYYRDQHLPLVRGLPGIRRFTMSNPRGLGGEAPHLVAELWFDDEASLKSALTSPEMAAAGQDADTFDVARRMMFTGEVAES